jgi:hypothetical protein
MQSVQNRIHSVRPLTWPSVAEGENFGPLERALLDAGSAVGGLCLLSTPRPPHVPAPQERLNHFCRPASVSARVTAASGHASRPHGPKATCSD